MEDPTEEIHKQLHEEAEKSGDRGIVKIALTRRRWLWLIIRLPGS